MVNPEWGTKRSCPKCSTRFYDLGKEDPVTCISCGNAWLPEPPPMNWSRTRTKSPVPTMKSTWRPGKTTSALRPATRTKRSNQTNRPEGGNFPLADGKASPKGRVHQAPSKCDFDGKNGLGP
jgi:hypothetical protein